MSETDHLPYWYSQVVRHLSPGKTLTVWTGVPGLEGDYQACSKPGHSMLKRNYYLNINTGFGELNLHISFDAQNGGSLDRTLGDLARREM